MGQYTQAWLYDRIFGCRSRPHHSCRSEVSPFDRSQSLSLEAHWQIQDLNESLSSHQCKSDEDTQEIGVTQSRIAEQIGCQPATSIVIIPTSIDQLHSS